MRVETGIISSQSSLRSPLNKNLSFSKDAEIAQKVIEFATAGLDSSEAAALRRRAAVVGLMSRNHFRLTQTITGTAAPTDLPDANFDGYFVGADGQTFASSTALKNILAVAPRNGGAESNKLLIYLNGINTTRTRLAANLQAIADATGFRTIGIYNAAQSGLLDTAQSSGDELNLGVNPAVDVLAETIYRELWAARGRSIHLLAYSQGAIVVSRALQDVGNRLRLEDGLSERETQNLLSRVKGETFGGAARHYPDGPHYIHYINRKDLVPQLFGLREFLNPSEQLGRNASTHYFNAGSGFLAHGLEEVYLRERVLLAQPEINNFNH